MFSRFNIHKKLYFVLGFLILVFFVGMEWSLYQSSKINTKINNLYTQELVSLEKMNNLKGALYRIRDRTLRIADAKNIEELKKHKKVIEDQLKRINQEIDKYDNTRLSHLEQEKLLLFKKHLNEYIRVLKKDIYPLANSFSNEEEINKILYKYAIDDFRAAREALNALSQYQIFRAKKRLENANEVFGQQKISIQAFIVFILLFSIYFSKKLMDSILIPIEKISQTLKRITEYDFSKKLTIEGKNEFTKIAFMLNENIETLKSTFTKLENMAKKDSLTNLPNRRAFEEELERLEKSQLDFALMFLDVDNFKNINDTYGHDIGDEFLIIFSKRLKQVLRKDDFLARLGGDEFAIIFNTSSEVHLGNIANKIVDKTSEPYLCSGYTMFSSVSIGIVVGKNHPNASMKQLMSYADIAMYRAKQSGKAGYTFFDTKMHESVNENMTLENALRSAMQNREFELYYQPIMDPKLGTLYGIETLLRWKKNGEIVPPMKFLPKLESTGMIKEVTYYIIEDTFSMINDQKLRCKVSINLSVLQFYDDNFIHHLKGLLKKYKNIEPENIFFEITESVFAQNSEYIRHSMLLIKDLGFNFSLDDFGTGYSSLSCLNDYPISALKIDKSFIDNIHISKKAEKLFSAIVNVAKELDLIVIVEGVESKKTLDLVTKHNKVKIQGYYFYEPLTKDLFLSILKE